MHPKNLSIADFTYNLTTEKIAKYPLEERDAGKLLVFNSGKITESVYRNLDTFLPDETLLVFNNTKVVEARLLFQKPTGGVVEIFCLEPADEYADVTSAMLQKGKVQWKCLIGGAGKWKHGNRLKKIINKNGEEIILEAAIDKRLADCFIIQLLWQPAELSFADVLHVAGQIPLPPYLHRQAEEKDEKSYQTIYAKHNGSVAAPTAGLHFTNNLFAKLAAKNIKKEFVTLHVGAGTFKPVKSETLDEHVMHAEFIEISEKALQNLIINADKITVAVGTTSLRTLESLYWMGVKIKNRPDASIDEISVYQWDVYEMTNENLPAKEALTALQSWMEKQQLKKLIAKTQILIAPGYSLKVAHGLITNFHQPQSTLLLLIAAIVGNEWKKIYQHALENNFRFLSYGDGCLLWKTNRQKFS